MAVPAPPEFDAPNGVKDSDTANIGSPMFEFGVGIPASASIATVVGRPITLSPSSGSAVPETAVELETEQEGNDVDEQILEALRSPKDRLFMLKIGDLMESLIADRETRTRAEMPPCASSYHRLLVHRCSTYYKLMPDTDPVTKIISVSVVGESKKPAKRLIDLVEMPSVTGPSFQIMRRGISRSTTSHSSDPPDGSDFDPSETGSSQSNTKAGKRLTITERKAAYDEARSRIFMGFSEKSSSTSSLSLSAAGRRSAGSSSVSVSASASNSSSGGEDGDNDNASTAPTESERSYQLPKLRPSNGKKARSNGSQSRNARPQTQDIEPEQPGPGVDPQTGLFIPALYDPSLAHQHPYGPNPPPMVLSPQPPDSLPSGSSPYMPPPPPHIYPYPYGYPPHPSYPPYGYYYPPPPPPPPPQREDQLPEEPRGEEFQQQPYVYGYAWNPPPEGADYPQPYVTPPEWGFHPPHAHVPPAPSSLGTPPHYPLAHPPPPPGVYAYPPQPIAVGPPPPPQPQNNQPATGIEHIHRPPMPRRGGGSSGSGGLAMGPRSNSGSASGRKSRGGGGIRDDVSVASSSSSSSRRAPPSTASTHSPHPLPARPDWAVGLTPQRADHRDRDRHREKADLGEFPPLPQSAPINKQPSQSGRGGAWGGKENQSPASNAGLTEGPQRVGEQPQHSAPPGPSYSYGSYPFPTAPLTYFNAPPPQFMGGRGGQPNSRLDEYDRQFERPPLRGRGELYNPKARPSNTSSPTNSNSGRMGSPKDGDKTKSHGGLVDSMKGLSLANKQKPPGVGMTNA